MNVGNVISELLSYKKDPLEDFYGILGCDRTSTPEQINAEYKARAREMHPDKSTVSDAAEQFQRLQIAKDILGDPQERTNYDKWLDAGIGMSFKQWRGMKEAARSSMHWSTPRNLGRMLGVDPMGDEPLSLRTSPSEVKEDNEEVEETKEEEASKAEDKDIDEEDITYPPTTREELGDLRVVTPPPELGWDRPREEREKEVLMQFDRERQQQLQKEAVLAAGARPKSSSSSSSSTQQKRKNFAQRRESSFGTTMIMEPMDDEEMRRRFRNYEI